MYAFTNVYVYVFFPLMLCSFVSYIESPFTLTGCKNTKE